jgi:hypothetical protein
MTTRRPELIVARRLGEEWAQPLEQRLQSWRDTPPEPEPDNVIPLAGRAQLGLPRLAGDKARMLALLSEPGARRRVGARLMS